MEVTVATFDVFLSHNSRDKAVERIAERLSRAGLEPWLDKWALVPGGAWQDELGRDARRRVVRGLRRPGRSGRLGTRRSRCAVDRAAKDRGFRVFPVLLPGV